MSRAFTTEFKREVYAYWRKHSCSYREVGERFGIQRGAVYGIIKRTEPDFTPTPQPEYLEENPGRVVLCSRRGWIYQPE